MEDERGYFLGLQGERVFHYDGRDPTEVHVPDIARALSRIDRYNGHGSIRWTVATHSLHVAWALRELGFDGLYLEGLLHDAEEAYVGDVIAPMKRALYPAYHQFLAPIRRCVRIAFGLEGDLPDHVREADTYVSYCESRLLFSHNTWRDTWGQPIPLMARHMPVSIPNEIIDFAEFPAEVQERRFKSIIATELSRELASIVNNTHLDGRCHQNPDGSWICPPDCPIDALGVT